MSSRNPRSIGFSAPGRPKCSSTKARLGSPSSHVVRSEHLAELGLGPVEELGRVAVDPAPVGVHERRIPRVTRKDLVGSLPRLDHLQRLRHLLREQVEGDRIVRDHRLAHRGDRAVQGREHPVGRHMDLVVVGLEDLGDHIGVAKFVALALTDVVKPDAERGESLLTRARQQPDDQARVQTAGQQHAHRNVGDHAPPYRGLERPEHLPRPVLLRPCGTLRTAAVIGRPVGVDRALPVRLDGHHGGGRELAHPLEDRVGSRNHPVPAEEVMQRDGVDLGVHTPSRQQRRERRGEPYGVWTLREVERLDAEPVARQGEPPPAVLEYRKGEHPEQVLDAPPAPAGVGLQDHLGVAVRKEPIAVAFQLARNSRWL